MLSECGLLGLGVYLALTVCIIYLGYRCTRLARGTPWQDFAVMLLPMLLALQVSYAYNRCLRDRTYWLVLALLIALHRHLRERRREQADPDLPPSPAPRATPPDAGPPAALPGQ
jgi:O-antigen ligase